MKESNDELFAFLKRMRIKAIEKIDDRQSFNKSDFWAQKNLLGLDVLIQTERELQNTSHEKLLELSKIDPSTVNGFRETIRLAGPENARKWEEALPSRAEMELIGVLNLLGRDFGIMWKRRILTLSAQKEKDLFISDTLWQGMVKKRNPRI